MASAILYGKQTQMAFDVAPKTIDEVMAARIKYIRETVTDRPVVFILMDHEDFRAIEHIAKTAINDYRVSFNPTQYYKDGFFDICGIRFSTPELEADLKASL